MVDLEQRRQQSLVGRLTGRLVEGVVDTVGPDVVLDQVDVDALLDRIDVNKLLDRVDPQILLDKVDVDRLLDRVDVDRLLTRVDVAALVRRAEVDSVVAQSTGRMAGGLLDLARRQLASADASVAGVLDRVVPTRRGAADRDQGVGHEPAGVASRFVAAALDAGAVLLLYTGMLAGIDLLAQVFGLGSVRGGSGAVGAGLAFSLFAGGYVLAGAAAGRSVGKALVGLRIVTVRPDTGFTRRVLLRSAAFWLTTLTAGIGFVVVVLHWRGRAWHDLVGGTVVVRERL